MNDHLSPTEAAEFDRRMRTDLVFFARMLYHETGLASLSPIGEVEEDILRWVQHGPQKRGVLCWREFGKTTIITCVYSAFRLFQDPEVKILVVSKSAGFATDVIRQVRNWIRTVWFLQHLDPTLDSNPSKRDRTSEFDLGPCTFNKAPSMAGEGIEGQLPGKRCSLLICDDIETPENTKTNEARAWLLKLTNEFHAISAYGEREILAVGTPHHEDSVYFKLAKNTVEFRTWPIVYPGPEDRLINFAPKYKDRLDRGDEKADNPLYSARFPAPFIAEKRAVGRIWFDMQYKLLANLAEATRYPLRLRDCIVLDELDPHKAPLSIVYGTRDHKGSTRVPDLECLGWEDDALHYPLSIDAPSDWKPYLGIKAGLDPAGRGKDKTGLSIVAASPTGTLFVLACLGLTGGSSSDCLDTIALACREHHVRDLYWEENFDTTGDYGHFLRAAMLRHKLNPGDNPKHPNGWSCSVTPIRVQGQKELRLISIIEPFLSGHRLVFARKSLEPSESEVHLQLQWQIAHLTRDRDCLPDDGKIDSLSIAIHQWAHLGAVLPERALDRHTRKAEEVVSELQALVQRAQPKKRSRWFTLRHFQQQQP